MVSNQYLSQLKYPERVAARKAVYKRVQIGSMPKADTLTCLDCGKPAKEYDHAKGYEAEYVYYVEPVCKDCHVEREMKRRVIIASTKARFTPLPNAVYSSEEAAELLGIKQITVQRIIKRGDIAPVGRAGNKYLIPGSSLMAFLGIK